MSLNIGFAMCGSFCTHQKAIEQMQALAEADYNIYPIFSYNTAKMDTKFGTAKALREKVLEICPNPIIDTIVKAEPIGPKKMCDAIVVMPCTGNTLAKIANGITDTPVTMAVKSHLRIGRPVIIALASNDSLGASAQNLGKLLNTKHIYFVPLSQDDPKNKPNSLVAHFDLLRFVIKEALSERQYQPVFL